MRLPFLTILALASTVSGLPTPEVEKRSLKSFRYIKFLIMLLVIIIIKEIYNQ